MTADPKARSVSGRRKKPVAGLNKNRRKATGQKVPSVRDACPACGKPVEGDWKVCPACGARIDPAAIRNA